MGTPNSSTEGSAVDFYPSDLYQSGDPKVFAQGEKCGELVRVILDELRPILRHIVAPVPVLLPGVGLRGCPYGSSLGTKTTVDDIYNSRERGVKLCEVRQNHYLSTVETESLFLSEQGDFYTARQCPDSSRQEHYHYKFSADSGAKTWQHAKFGTLLEALKRMLGEATEKREAHLAAIRERDVVLDQLLAVMKREK